VKPGVGGQTIAFAEVEALDRYQQVPHAGGDKFVEFRVIQLSSWIRM
jgi:hypothetical protein